MNLILGLCWYDEHPANLRAVVSSCAGVAKCVVAVDGAYRLYPGGQRTSHPAQTEAIQQAATDARMRSVIVQPFEPWAGNEADKRSAMYEVVDSVAEPGDWLLVLDADERLTRWPTGTNEALASSTKDMAEVTLWTEGAADWPGCRRLFRTGIGVRVVGMHANFQRANGRYLRWDGAEQLHDVRVEHRQDEHRDPHRLWAKRRYYAIRDELGAEPPIDDAADRAEYLRSGDREGRGVAS